MNSRRSSERQMGSLAYVTPHWTPLPNSPKFLDTLWESWCSLCPPPKRQRLNGCQHAIQPTAMCCQNNSSHSFLLPAASAMGVASHVNTMPGTEPHNSAFLGSQPGKCYQLKFDCGCGSSCHLLGWFLARMTIPSSPQFKSGGVDSSPLCLRSISMALYQLCFNIVWSFVKFLLRSWGLYCRLISQRVVLKLCPKLIPIQL